MLCYERYEHTYLENLKRSENFKNLSITFYNVAELKIQTIQ